MLQKTFTNLKIPRPIHLVGTQTSSSLEVKKIARSPFGDQLEKYMYSRQMQNNFKSPVCLIKVTFGVRLFKVLSMKIRIKKY